VGVNLFPELNFLTNYIIARSNGAHRTSADPEDRLTYGTLIFGVGFVK